MNFNPRTPCGVRLFRYVENLVPVEFQSTHPLRGATRVAGTVRRKHFISIHAPLAGCDRMVYRHAKQLFISIHAPLAGCDGIRASRYTAVWISIHAPLAGCDQKSFLSRLPRENFNPRTPCGVRLVLVVRFGFSATISIHAPLAGCDMMSTEQRKQQNISIHAPLAGCDMSFLQRTSWLRISIHAPLAGCDNFSFQIPFCFFHFNPRTPCGVRLRPTCSCLSTSTFQSTHPLRGATSFSDALPGVTEFQSTHPLRGATSRREIIASSSSISIHAPLAGCDSRA